MTKTEKLKMAYNDLKNGKIIAFIDDETGHNCICWVNRSRTNKRKRYIFWRCFGQSANEMGLSNLRWIAKTIANCNSYNYKIVDSIYEGV